MILSSVPSRRFFVSCVNLFISVLLINKAECDIFTLNNKYLNLHQTQTLKTINFGGSIRDVDLNSPGVWERMKRDVSQVANSGSSNSSDLILDRSVLDGSQTTSRAFVHWIGKETSEKLLVLTCSISFLNGIHKVTESQLWSSDDYGSTFNRKTIGRGNVQISFFYTVPTDSKKLIFTDVGSKTIYTTSDELETFETFDVPVDPDAIVPHPFVQDVVLLYSLLHRKLYVSMDFAKTWSLLSENVLPTFYWASEHYDSNPLLVHMEIEGSVPTQALYKACIVPSCDKAAENIQSVGPFLPKSLIVHKEFMFVQKLNAKRSEGYLMVSYNREPFQRAYFPENVKTDDFIILNLDDGQVFIGVNHGDKVNLYLSDETGHYYVLSLSDVSHQIVGSFYFGIDLHEVQGMNWTFVANARNSDSSKSVKTYISYDKGGNWAPLQVSEDLKKECPSKDNCEFKLVVMEGILGSSIMSNENAPGIILAHGTIGSHPTMSNVSVFTSRDGGWTWKKAPFSGTHRFNILDQGSVLSAVPVGILSNTLTKKMHYMNPECTLKDMQNLQLYRKIVEEESRCYSCDEGDTWADEVFDPDGLLVKGVLTEPSILTLTEMLFGHEAGPMKPWTLVKLNFSSILSRRCGKDDYESWYPKDYNSATASSCTLGRKQEYTRRKQSASCHNGEVFIPRIKPDEVCECTGEDYECDFGYKEEGDVCIKTKWFYDGYLPFDCVEGSTYYKSKGYRKIPADVCLEKEAEKKKYDKEKSECPSMRPHGLLITSHNNYVVTGKEASFFLEQTGGSRRSTTYTWNFDDESEVQNFTDYQNASQASHIFVKAGHYNISITAENSKGKSSAFLLVHVQDQISSIFLMAPKAGKVGQPVKISITVASAAGRHQEEQDRIHYVWTFGDEKPSNLPTLSWTSEMVHTYEAAGTYHMSVDAVNSVSSLSQPFSIRIFEKAIIMVITMSSLNIGKNPNPIYMSLLLERLQQQLLEDLGVNTEQIEVVLVKFDPVQAHLYILPFDESGELSQESIKEKITSLVEKGEFGINLFGKQDEPGKIFKVDSIKPLADSDGKRGPNMTPVYIAVPVLVIILVSSVFLFFYCRRKVRNVRQYNLLSTQDDSDALLDDDDEAPLDLDIDFGARESSRDDSMIDGGGNHLVMVTGDRLDGGENC